MNHPAQTDREQFCVGHGLPITTLKQPLHITDEDAHGSVFILYKHTI